MPPGIGYGPFARRLPFGLLGEPDDFPLPLEDMPDPARAAAGRMPRTPLQGPGMPSPRAAGQRAPGPSGLMKLLQQPGLRDALMATGSALMAQSDRPGTLGGALGRALPAGMQAFEQGRSQAAVQEALQGAPESMRRLIGSLPPGQQAAAAMQMMQPQQRDPVALDPGDVLVDPTTGEAVAENTRAPDAPSDIRTFERFRNMTPEEQQAFLGMLEARRDATTVNVGQEGSPAEQALVDIEARDVESSMEASRQAQDQLASLNEVERLLDEGVETGAIEEKTMGLRELGAAFGVGNTDELIRQQNFRALTNEIAIGMTQGLQGQISERELDFVRAAVPSLGTTPEANRRIVEIGKRVNQTAIDVAEAKREYFRDNGTLDGFEPVRRRIVRENLLDKLPSRYSPNNPFDPGNR